MALTDVRVIDTSFGIAGGYCAKLLGDAGADVIKVEPGDGDPLRSWACGGGLAAGVDGALFRFLHHGHRSVTESDGDRAASELIAGADVLICGSSGPFGDPRTIAERQPGLVVIAISPYGLTGPYAGFAASELTIQADSGGLAARGHPDGIPVQAGGQVTEWCTGVYAAVAAMAALRHARRDGHGELVDVSWCEVSNLTSSMFVELFHSLAGRPELAQPARYFETPSIEPTLDGYVGFCPNSRQQFDSFLVLIDRTDLLGDEDWAQAVVRIAKHDEWNAIVRAWTSKHTTQDIIEQAARLRIPVAPVSDAPALLGLDHAVARGVFVEDPTGSFTMPRRPWQIDSRLPPAPAPAPTVGQHSESIEPKRRNVPEATSHPVSMPLAGLRVLDLTAWWAGPSATGIMAAFGADVIHVESADRLDGARLIGGRFSDQPQWWERSPIFMQANANKREVTIDLTTDRGREIVLQLVETVDMVVENFTPRVMDSFNLGWDVFHERNPQAVVVRMPAFGLDGPWRDRPGFAQTMEQVTGLAWLTGEVDDQPRIQRGPCDPNGGMHGAFAALAGLAQRDSTGVGCFVEAPMFEAALNIAAELVIEYTAYGNELCRDGNRSPRAAPQGIYRCLGDEHWVAVSVLHDDQWRALVKVLGEPPRLLDPVFGTASGRRAHHDELDALLQTWAVALHVDQAVTILRAAEIPAAHVTDPRHASLLPQFIHRGYTEFVEHPVIGTHPLPSLPFRVGSIERWLRRRAPTLGEHSVEVLTAIGCSPDDITVLTNDRITADWPAGIARATPRT